MLDNKRLEEIRERAERATAGPWFNGSWYGQCHINHEHGKGNCVYDHVKVKKDYECYVSSEGEKVLIGSDEWGDILNKNDANFIAHARQDIPDLLAYIEELQGAIQILANKWRSEYPVIEIDTAIKEAEKLIGGSGE